MDVGLLLHPQFWRDVIGDDHLSGGYLNFNHDIMQMHYNKEQLLKKARQKLGIFKWCLVENGLFKIACDRFYNRYDKKDKPNATKPVSKNIIRQRLQKLIGLALTHDASIGITNDFLCQLTSKLIDKNDNVKTHIQEKMTPLIIRDLNKQLQSYRENPDRIRGEALMLRNQHISTRKHLKTRTKVSQFIIIKHIITLQCYKIQYLQI